MIDQEILRLNIQRKRLYDELNQMNSQLLVKSQEINEITTEQQENLQDQCQRIEENINFMSNKIIELNAFCKANLDDKKRITDNIKRYAQKRQSLTNILESQSRKLQQIKVSNLQIEEQIKMSRLQYEYLQDDIFNLDIKIENLKKYGMEIVPEQIILKITKKEELAQQSKELDKRIEIEKAELETMISIDQKEKILKKIEQLQIQTKQMSEMAETIQELKLQNQELNKIKNQYEWNPNLQIKQLEISEQQQEQKICSIDKEITAIRKKSTECMQKIQNYKNYLKKQETLRREKQVPNFNDQGKETDEANLKKSKYCDIKRDLQIQSNKENVSFMQSVRQLFIRKKQNKENIIIDERTYRVTKSINLLQFWFIVIVLLVMLFYNHKNAKKI